jgi:hypothetical protein
MWAQVTAPKGILCGADSRQEWLLPWWWSRYSLHHDYPVTFCDFGMTEDAQAWCREKGSLVTIPRSSPVDMHDVDPHLVKQWESCYTSRVWDFRAVWFQKPLALLNSTYQKAVWIDLDCEILKPLHTLFNYCDPTSQLGLLREFTWHHLPRFHPSIVYNSGVIVFEHGAPILEKWAKTSGHLSHLFWGDEVLLSHLIYEEKLEVFELPGRYNWRVSQGIDMNAAIVHWLGCGGKEYIRRFGGLKPSLDQCFRTPS